MTGDATLAHGNESALHESLSEAGSSPNRLSEQATGRPAAESSAVASHPESERPISGRKKPWFLFLSRRRKKEKNGVAARPVNGAAPETNTTLKPDGDPAEPGSAGRSTVAVPPPLGRLARSTPPPGKPALPCPPPLESLSVPDDFDSAAEVANLIAFPGPGAGAKSIGGEASERPADSVAPGMIGLEEGWGFLGIPPIDSEAGATVPHQADDGASSASPVADIANPRPGDSPSPEFSPARVKPVPAAREDKPQFRSIVEIVARAEELRRDAPPVDEPEAASVAEDDAEEAAAVSHDRLRQIRSQLRADLADCEKRVREEEKARVAQAIESEILIRAEMIAKAEERIRDEVSAETAERIRLEKEKSLREVAEAKQVARKAALQEAWEHIRAEERAAKQMIADAIERVRSEIEEETSKMIQADSRTRDEAVIRAEKKARAEALAEGQKRIEALREATVREVAKAEERAREEIRQETEKKVFELEAARQFAIADAESRAKTEALQEAVEMLQALETEKRRAIREAEEDIRARVKEEAELILRSDPETIEEAVAEAEKRAREEAIEEARQMVLSEERIRVQAIMAAEERVRAQVFEEARREFDEAVHKRAETLVEEKRKNKEVKILPEALPSQSSIEAEPDLPAARHSPVEDQRSEEVRVSKEEPEAPAASPQGPKAASVSIPLPPLKIPPDEIAESRSPARPRKKKDRFRGFIRREAKRARLKTIRAATAGAGALRRAGKRVAPLAGTLSSHAAPLRNRKPVLPLPTGSGRERGRGEALFALAGKQVKAISRKHWWQAGAVLASIAGGALLAAGLTHRDKWLETDGRVERPPSILSELAESGLYLDGIVWTPNPDGSLVGQEVVFYLDSDHQKKLLTVDSMRFNSPTLTEPETSGLESSTAATPPPSISLADARVEWFGQSEGAPALRLSGVRGELRIDPADRGVVSFVDWRGRNGAGTVRLQGSVALGGGASRLPQFDQVRHWLQMARTIEGTPDSEVSLEVALPSAAAADEAPVTAKLTATDVRWRNLELASVHASLAASPDGSDLRATRFQLALGDGFVGGKVHFDRQANRLTVEGLQSTADVGDLLAAWQPPYPEIPILRSMSFLDWSGTPTLLVNGTVPLDSPEDAKWTMECENGFTIAFDCGGGRLAIEDLRGTLETDGSTLTISHGSGELLGGKVVVSGKNSFENTTSSFEGKIDATGIPLDKILSLAGRSGSQPGGTIDLNFSGSGFQDLMLVKGKGAISINRARIADVAILSSLGKALRQASPLLEFGATGSLSGVYAVEFGVLSVEDLTLRTDGIAVVLDGSVNLLNQVSDLRAKAFVDSPLGRAAGLEGKFVEVRATGKVEDPVLHVIHVAPELSGAMSEAERLARAEGFGDPPTAERSNRPE